MFLSKYLVELKKIDYKHTYTGPEIFLLPNNEKKTQKKQKKNKKLLPLSSSPVKLLCPVKLP